MEGYQDHYEVEYKKIDFKQEARMIDCIPSFVKENYDYLMKSSSKASVGKSSSGLDDSGSDVLNQAYIETPPGVDDVDGSKLYKSFFHLMGNCEFLNHFTAVVLPLFLSSFNLIH